MTKSAGRAVVLFCLLTIAAVAPAADWNRWLGPDQNGKSPETGIFGEEIPTLDVTWSHRLGKAYSAIAIADGKAVTMFGDGKTDWLIALDASNGEELWRYRIDKMFPNKVWSKSRRTSYKGISEMQPFAFLKCFFLFTAAFLVLIDFLPPLPGQ